MIRPLVEFSRALRQSGARVSAAEALDAAQALTHLPLEDRETFRLGLRAALVKEQRHLATFDRLFEEYFAVMVGGGTSAKKKQAQGGGEGEGQPAQNGERASGQPSSPSGSQTDQPPVASGKGDASTDAPAKDQDEKAAAEARETSNEAPSETSALTEDESSGDVAADGMDAEELLARVRLGTGQEPQTRQRQVLSPSQARDLRDLPPGRVPDLYEAVALLAKRLATRPSRRYRAARRGSVDLRRTLQRGFRSGDLPFGLEHRRRRLDRCQLVVLCDVSGSVWQVSRFFLALVTQLHTQFAHTRSFLFVDRVVETAALNDGQSFIEDLRADPRLNLFGRSDYGRALYQFYTDQLPQLARRTVLVILGDARTNDFEPLAWTLEETRRRVRRILWLNPDPKASWDQEDSVMAAYAPFCDHVLECRDLEQLEQAGAWLVRQAVL